MERKRRPVNSYTFNELLRIARKYQNRTDFFNNERSAVRAAKILQWYDKCTAHMEEKQKPKDYWTKELCKIEALKFTSRFEFFKKGSAAYQAAKKKGWLDEICSHMIPIRKRQGFWQEEINLINEALKYTSRTEFARESPSAYAVATLFGVLDEICFHMPRIGNAKNKLVYAWEFADKSVYIGLTFSIKDREKRRACCHNDAVTIHRNKTRQTAKLKLLTDLLPVEEAVKEEIKYVDSYERKGWAILNRSKPGAIGGNIIIWTKKNCLRVARKCSSKKEFYTQYASAYDSARRNGWLLACYRHIKTIRKPPKYWTDENIQRVAFRCKTRSEFEKKYGSAYNAALQKRIMDKVCRHMKSIKTPNNFWTFKRIIEVAKKCESIQDFAKRHDNVYQAARINRWLNKIYKKMKWVKKTHKFGLGLK